MAKKKQYKERIENWTKNDVLINFRIPAGLKRNLDSEVKLLPVCPNLSAYLRWIVENRFKIPKLRSMHKQLSQNENKSVWDK